MQGLTAGGKGHDPLVFRAGVLDSLSQSLSAVPSGDARVAAIRDLAGVAVFLQQAERSPSTAQSLWAMLEGHSSIELVRVTREEVSSSTEQGLTVKAEFAQFQGKQPEQLPDTGERLDPKLLRGAGIRG